MKFLGKIIKYGLYSLVFAVIASGLILSFIFLQETAGEIGRPELTLSTRGAERDLSQFKDEVKERRQPELTGEEEDTDWDYVQEFYPHREEMALPREITAGLERLQDNRRYFIETDKENRLSQFERALEREFYKYSRQRREKAEQVISEKEAELAAEIAEVERELTDRELDILKEVRKEARQEYRNELLNLQVKLRTMDLSSRRREEIETRLEEINREIDNRVEMVRNRLESRLEQERLRQISQLERRYNSQIRSILSELESDLERKRAEIAEETAAFSREKEEQIQDILARQQELLEKQLEQFKERYLRIYGDS